MAKLERIQSPILTYAHLDHGNRVDLVGTVHIGEPDYYRDLQEYIDERVNEGAIVHYETTEHPTETGLLATSRFARRKFQQIESLTTELEGLIGIPDGLVSQSEGLVYRDNWQNHDKPSLELAADMSYMGIAGLWIGIKLLKLAGSRLDRDRLHEIMFNRVSKESVNVERELQLPIVAKSLYKSLLQGRNNVAIAAVDEVLAHNPTQDLVLLWGPGHIAGLHPEIQRRGFVETGRQWLTAVHAR